MNDLTISLFGLLTSLLVVALLVFVELEWGFAPYSLVHFLVVPTGAALAGLLAASGYYVGALVLHVRPTPRFLFNVVIVSVACYVILHYAPVDTVATTAAAGDAGLLGYLVALLQIGGFTLGGYGVHHILRRRPCCSDCDRYFKRIWRDVRYSRAQDGAAVATAVQRITSAIDGGDNPLGRQTHQRLGERMHTQEADVKTRFTLLACQSCGGELLTFTVWQRHCDQWEEVPQLSFTRQSVSSVSDTLAEVSSSAV